MQDELAKLLCRCNGPVMSLTLHMLSDDQPTKRALVPALHERSRLQAQGGSPAELLGSSNHRDGEGFLVNGGLQHLAVHARDPVLLLQTCLPSASAVWEVRTVCMGEYCWEHALYTKPPCRSTLGYSFIREGACQRLQEVPLSDRMVMASLFSAPISSKVVLLMR